MAVRRLDIQQQWGVWAGVAETVHNRIAMLRAERKITRPELSEALGVHYQTIGYLERGECSPPHNRAIPMKMARHE